jgi:antitoxin component YwqK of YwqJK toxin-antitoxin module
MDKTLRINILDINRSRDDDGYIYWQGKLFTGIEEDYYENGLLGEEIEYVNGIPDGRSRWWHENGQLGGEDFYKEGCIHGYVREWYKSGQIKKEEEIYHGIAVTEKEWDENGNLILDINKNGK